MKTNTGYLDHESSGCLAVFAFRSLKYEHYVSVKVSYHFHCFISLCDFYLTNRRSFTCWLAESGVLSACVETSCVEKQIWLSS